MKRGLAISILVLMWIVLLCSALFLNGCAGTQVSNNVVPVCDTEEPESCDDCSAPTDFTSYNMVRNEFCLATDSSGSLSLHSMPKKYSHWPTSNYRHALSVWVRDDGAWTNYTIIGFNIQGGTPEHFEKAKEKIEVLKYHIDDFYPEGVVAFSYMIFLHEAVIYLDNAATMEDHEILVKGLNRKNGK